MIASVVIGDKNSVESRSKGPSVRAPIKELLYMYARVVEIPGMMNE